MKMLALCFKCRQLLSEAFDVLPAIVDITHPPETPKKCENCKKASRDLKICTIEKKGK